MAPQDCTLSKAGTRKCDSDKCKEWQDKTRCTGADCTEGYEAGRVPYPKVYPGNNKGSFAPQDNEDDAQKCSKWDSALQWLKCGIPCPAPFPMSVEDFTGQAAVVLAFIVISMAAGFATYFKIGGSYQQFFVAGRDLPVWILVCTLGSQCLDASSALGNLDLAYKYHFWDGAALPIGLALSLHLGRIPRKVKSDSDTLNSCWGEPWVSPISPQRGLEECHQTCPADSRGSLWERSWPSPSMK